MKKQIVFSLIAILLCSTSVAFGYVIGSSNLGLMGYPSFESTHYKPSKPLTRDEYSINRYKQEVKTYMEEARTYVESANNDIQRIHEEKNSVINDANDVVNEYNSYINYGY
jgi:hypothetical protein